MKRILFLFSCLVCTTLWGQVCTVNNAAGCVCLEADSTNCYLLPDIKVSEDILLDPLEVIETYGQLAISISTPNIGHGPLQIRATDYYVCGTDTIYSPGGYGDDCSDGSAPSQLIKQLVYRKAGDEMLIGERWAGSMTYHPTHQHMHVDDWGVFSLREKVDGLDPLDSPMVGDGAKIGFCLMDYGTCDFYSGHCRSDNNDVLTSGNIDNYGLGGGSFACGFDQGISVGYTDIYGNYLDGMQIPINEGVCNGDYWLVVEVDPQNNFLEENDDNNVIVTTVTLTEQTLSSEQIISTSGATKFCYGESIELTANYGNTFDWSHGEASQSVIIDKSGIYSVMIETECGMVSSEEIEVEVYEGSTPVMETDVEEALCVGQSIELEASAEEEVIRWYDVPEGGELLAEGGTYLTPELEETTTFYAETEKEFVGTLSFSEPHDHTFGGGGWNNPFFNGHLIFDCYFPFRLMSVKVFAADSSERTIEIVNAAEEVLFSQAYPVDSGENTLIIDADIPTGEGHIMRTAESPNFFRNNTDVNFPYDLGDGLGSIVNSSYGEEYFYYFFDWEVLSPDFICPSPRTPITVEVQVCSNINNLPSVSEISILPNPTQGDLQILFSTIEGVDLEARMLDLQGRLISQQTRQVSTGQHQMSFEMGTLSSGVYLIELQEGENVFHQKVVKVH